MDKGSAKFSDLDRSLVHEELQRLIESPGLQHAESLRLLLRYLVERALNKPQEHVKEYQIAVDVFGRSDSFDPRLDSTIRVQTSRLRNKLVDYYGKLGAHDPLIIEIPRGTYSPIIRRRTSPPVAAPVTSTLVAVAPEVYRTGRMRRRWAPLSGLMAGLALGLSISWLVGWLPHSTAVAGNRGDQQEVRAFWSSVLRSPDPPLVIFSNAEFVGRPETGLRYFNPAHDSPNNIEDLYTGVGETLAVAGLSDLFRGLNREMIVKSSRLLSWDETKNRDLIFVGSPSENLSLRDLPLSQEFVFRAMHAGEPRPGDLAIVNNHPRPGEAQFFIATASVPLTEDYALVMLQPGQHADQNVLWLAGTTTLGTQAAAEFVCSNDNLAVLRGRLGLAPNAPYGPFSAVLHIRVARGVPVKSEIAAVHRSSM